jgi:hypothetical protein
MGNTKLYFGAVMDKPPPNPLQKRGLKERRNEMIAMRRYIDKTTDRKGTPQRGAGGLL